MGLIDRFGRKAVNLRISVTDRCNFRCRYCMPEEGMKWMERKDLLSFEELERLVRIFAGLGVTKLRLTGGEPLMRKDLWKLVELVRPIPGINDIALTTNGFFLKEQAAELVKAGLNRFNVSLDALDPATFNAMARRDYFDRTWEGIEEALRLGAHPIKVNAVLIRGINEAEIPRFVELAQSKPVIVRFIEFMPIGKDDEWSFDKVVTTQEVIDAINAIAPIVAVPHNGSRAPADRYVFQNGKGEVGFISSVSEPFCGDCNRVRITSDGKFRTCLFALKETDLRAMLRGGSSDQEIAGALVEAVHEKEEGHLINRPGFVRPERTMSQIGG